jgi:hypothetical protein
LYYDEPKESQNGENRPAKSFFGGYDKKAEGVSKFLDEQDRYLLEYRY